MHLTITIDKDILIFPHWKRYLMLRHHRVLINDSSQDYPENLITLFQLHSRSQRTANERVRGIAADVRYIAYELLQTYALLFFRHAIREHRQSAQSQRHVSRSHSYRLADVWSRPWGPKSPDEIIRRLMLGFNQSEWDGIMPWIQDKWGGDYSPQSREFQFFSKRLEALKRELTVWKPSTYYETILYPGWAGKYWHLGLTLGSVFALLTLALTSVQVYFAIHPRSASS